MITSTHRGNKIYFDGYLWRYSDTNLEIDNNKTCVRCGRSANTDGSDACIGHIDGAISACCGHGVEDGYVKMCNHKTTSGFSAIEYNSTYEMRSDDMHCKICGKHGTREELEAEY